MSEMTPTTTAGRLSRALRAATLPLTHSSMTARRAGYAWIELTVAGDYRITSVWGNCWARAYAPRLDEGPYAGPDMPAFALRLAQVDELLYYTSGHMMAPGTPIALDRHAPLYACAHATPLPGAPQLRNNVLDVFADAPGHEDPFPLPTPSTARARALPAALAATLGAYAEGQDDAGLGVYAVPERPNLAAWTLGDWAHGQILLPVRHRNLTRQALDGLAAREEAATAGA